MLVGILLAIKLYWHIMGDITNNMSTIQENLIIKHRFLPDGRDHFSFSVKPGFNLETSQRILKYDAKEYLALIPLEGFLKSYKHIESHYTTRALLIIHLFYLIGWLYILIKNIIIL
jgi:hypothetical protein